ncbi:MAG TPA: hypothetical protein VN577_11685 [Terriglobales bacterium]|nr:hypothetical protein [Terriglobales bacterium]
MSVMAVADLEALKDEIIRELQTRALRPTDVLTSLHSRYPDPEIKEVILQLLQEGKLELSSDRRLHVAQVA